MTHSDAVILMTLRRHTNADITYTVKAAHLMKRLVALTSRYGVEIFVHINRILWNINTLDL